MEDIQINEEALLKWQQQRRKEIGIEQKPNWIDKLYHKTNKVISVYFREVSWIFKEWKEHMRISEEGIKSLYEDRKTFAKLTKVYYPTGFTCLYIGQKDDSPDRTLWDVYSKMAKEPTITEFLKFMKEWKPGEEKVYTGGNIFSFEEMFLK